MGDDGMIKVLRGIVIWRVKFIDDFEARGDFYAQSVAIRYIIDIFGLWRYKLNVCDCGNSFDAFLIDCPMGITWLSVVMMVVLQNAFIGGTF